MDTDGVSNGSMFLETPLKPDRFLFGTDLTKLDVLQHQESLVAATFVTSLLVSMLDKSLLEKEFLHKVPEITTHQLLQHIDSIVPFGLNDQPQKCEDDPESELEPKAIVIDRWASLRLPVFQRGAPKTPLSPVSRQSFEVVSPKGWAGSMQANSPKKVKDIQIHLESVEELPKELNGVESVSFQQLPAADLSKDHRTHLPINQLSPHQMGTTSMFSPMNRTHESMGDWIRSARKFITAMDAPNMPDLIPLKEIHSRPTTAEQKLRIMKEQQVIREKNMQREAKLRQELMEQNKANAKKHVKTLTYDFEGKSFEVNPSKPQGKTEQVVVSLA